MFMGCKGSLNSCIGAFLFFAMSVPMFLILLFNSQFEVSPGSSTSQVTSS